MPRGAVKRNSAIFEHHSRDAAVLGYASPLSLLELMMRCNTSTFRLVYEEAATNRLAHLDSPPHITPWTAFRE